MPIYAYRCATCGHAQDVLQKLSDPLLSVCPACGAPTFQKQITAAGFQLKGSGWYVTDFRDGGGAKPAADAKPAESPSADGKAAPADAPAAPAPAPAATPVSGAPAAAPPAGGSSGSGGSTPSAQ